MAISSHTRSEPSGVYLGPGVAYPGWYTITATALDYKPVSQRVLYREGYTAALDFELERE